MVALTALFRTLQFSGERSDHATGLRNRTSLNLPIRGKKEEDLPRWNTEKTRRIHFAASARRRRPLSR